MKRKLNVFVYFILLLTLLAQFGCKNLNEDKVNDADAIRKDSILNVKISNILSNGISVIQLIDTMCNDNNNRIIDFSGTNADLRGYYVLLNNVLIKKEFKVGPSMVGTKAEFLLSHESMIRYIVVKMPHNNVGYLIKARVFNANIDPSQIKIY